VKATYPHLFNKRKKKEKEWKRKEKKIVIIFHIVITTFIIIYELNISKYRAYTQNPKVHNLPAKADEKFLLALPISLWLILPLLVLGVNIK
jgi:amino acid transporter